MLYFRVSFPETAMDTELITPLETACRTVGGASQLAKLLTDRLGRTVSKASVSRWKKDGIPAEVCPDIEALTGVPCEDLKPKVNWAVLRTRKPTRKPPQPAVPS